MPPVKSIYQSAKSRERGKRLEEENSQLPTRTTPRAYAGRTHAHTRSLAQASVRTPQPSQPCKNFYFFFVSASGLSSRTLQKKHSFFTARDLPVHHDTPQCPAHAQFLLQSRRHFGTKSFLHNGWIVVSRCVRQLLVRFIE